MVSIGVPRLRHGWMMVLAAFGTAGEAAAQAPDTRELDVRTEIAEQILAAQASGGPQAEALIGLYTRLGLLYREDGSAAPAVAAFNQARQVVRANFGLYSLAQVPLVLQQILALEALGDFAGAWDLEKDLARLAAANADDPGSIPVFRELGDRRLDLLERYLAGESYQPQVALGCYYSRPAAEGLRAGVLGAEPARYPAAWMQGNCSAGSRGAAADAILSEAQRYYLDAIDAMGRNDELRGTERARELELDLLRASYLHGRTTATSYEIGLESLDRLVEYDSPESTLTQRADSLVHRADWDLLFGRYADAVAAYEQVHAWLQRQGAPKSALDALFAPGVPVALPTFLPSGLESNRGDTTAYVDVAFDITRFGASQRIDVVDATASAEAQQRVVKAIARSRFRPQLANGEFARSTRVVARYYVDE